jgi:hypothetical protein
MIASQVQRVRRDYRYAYTNFYPHTNRDANRHAGLLRSDDHAGRIASAVEPGHIGRGCVGGDFVGRNSGLVMATAFFRSPTTKGGVTEMSDLIALMLFIGLAGLISLGALFDFSEWLIERIQDAING